MFHDLVVCLKKYIRDEGRNFQNFISYTYCQLRFYLWIEPSLKISQNAFPVEIQAKCYLYLQQEKIKTTKCNFIRILKRMNKNINILSGPCLSYIK